MAKLRAENKLVSFWGWLKSDRRRLIGIVVIILLLVFGYLRIRASAASKIQFQTSTVQKGTVVSTISASGKAISTSVLPINTQASGIVAKVYVKDGDEVVKGQKIAQITLDSDGALAFAKATASLISAQNSLDNANNNYRSSQASLANTYDQLSGHASDESLSQKETRTKAEVANDNAYNGVKGAQANLTSAALAYQESSPTIVAPSSGIVTNINLVEGMVITASTNSTTGAVSSQRIAVIKNEATPIVDVTLGETEVPNVQIGQKATVTFDSIIDKTFTGTVATVDRIGTVSSNVTSYDVNIKLDSGSDLILPNMAATADIIVNTATDVLFVPSTALTTQNGSTLAKTLVNGKEVDVPVEIGISSDTDTSIISGLSEGQEVITGTQTEGSTSTQNRSVFSSGFGGGGGARVIGR